MASKREKEMWVKVLHQYSCDEIVKQYKTLNVRGKQMMLDALQSVFQNVKLSNKIDSFSLCSLSPSLSYEGIKNNDLALVEVMKALEMDVNYSNCEKLKVLLKQWGCKKPREEVLPQQISMFEEMKREQKMSATGMMKLSNKFLHSTVVKNNNYCEIDFTKLKKVYIHDLKLFETSKGNFIEGTILTPSTVCGSNIVTYIEDAKGEYVQLGVNNLIPNTVDPWDYTERMYPPGLKIMIAEPFYKIFADGQIGIRVDSPNEIIRLDENINNFVEIRKQGKELIKTNDVLGALKLYLDGVKHYNDTFTLLNNRSQTELKLGQYEEALLDSAAVLFLEPKNSKARLRYQSALQQLGHIEGNKESNRLAWKKVLTHQMAKESEGNIADGTKEKGNSAYKEGKFEAAKKEYSSVLNNNSNEICILLNNIAIVCIKLHIYQTAISASNASLRISSDKNHQTKARFSMTKAFSMLCELELAKISSNGDSTLKQFWNSANNPEKVVEELMQKRREAFSPDTESFSETSKETEGYEIPGDYIKPNTMKHSYTPCKGRGIVANRNIQEGELLVIDHPVCQTKPTSPDVANYVFNVDLNSSKKLINSQLELKKRILALVPYDGLLVKKLLMLETKRFERIVEISEDEEKNNLPLVDLEWMGYRNLCHYIQPFLPQAPYQVGVDVGRITETLVNDIVFINAFTNTPKNKRSTECGLFLRLSLFNHDSIPNCSYFVLGDCKVVFAHKNIPAGEELTTSYGTDENVLARWGF